MKKLFLLFGIIFSSVSVVSATSFDRSSAIEKDYERLSKYMSDAQMQYVSEKSYEKILNEDVESYDSIIVASTYYYPDNISTPFLIEEKVMSAEEASVYSSDGCTYLSSTRGECETEYKSLEMLVSNISGRKMFYFRNIWKKMPKYKSFDVIAFRWTGGFSLVQYSGMQYTNVGNVTYAQTSGNFMTESNGVGLSQNLIDDATSIENELTAIGTCSSGGEVFGTYQHAQADLTLAQSKYYMFSASGMGRVLSFYGTSIGKYDDTPGLKFTYTC